MSIRFLADSDLDVAIVTGLRAQEPAIDFMTANQANLYGRKDPFVLEFAANQGRILVSHDRRTMPGHFSARLRSGRRSPGVLLVRQHSSVGPIVEALLLIWSDSSPEEWTDQIRYLPSLERHAFRR
jgi:hypothetical protein